MNDTKKNQCIDSDLGNLITQFEFGQLDDSDRERFEEHMMECDYCLSEIEEMLPTMVKLRERQEQISQMLSREGKSFEIVEKHLFAKHKRKVAVQRFIKRIKELFDRILTPVVAVPAGAVVLVVLLFIIIRQPTNPYMDYLEFTKYPYTQSLRAGVETDSVFQWGMNAYLEDDLESAISNIGESIQSDSTQWMTWFYLGVCYYLDHQPPQAIEAFKKADSLSIYTLEIEIRWYLAQAYLLNGERKEAIPLLEWIASQPGEYSSKAEKLLLNIREPSKD